MLPVKRRDDWTPDLLTIEAQRLERLLQMGLTADLTQLPRPVLDALLGLAEGRLKGEASKGETREVDRE